MSEWAHFQQNKRIQAYMLTYIHTYIHIYIHTYIHTLAERDLCALWQRMMVSNYHHSWLVYILILQLSRQQFKDWDLSAWSNTYIHTIHTYIHTYIHTLTLIQRLESRKETYINWDILIDPTLQRYDLCIYILILVCMYVMYVCMYVCMYVLVLSDCAPQWRFITSHLRSIIRIIFGLSG